MQKTTDHIAIDTNGNKPNSIPHERHTMTQDHSTTFMADESKQTGRPTQSVPNSPVKPDAICSKPDEPSDKTSSSEASTDYRLPFGWDPACISPHPARGPRRHGTYHSRAPEYYNPNPAFCKGGRIPQRFGRESPPPEAPHQHELDPHNHWITTQLDPDHYPGMPLGGRPDHVHFQPADVRMPEPRPINIHVAPANRPCVDVYDVSDLHKRHGFYEHSLPPLKAENQVPWVHGFPMPRIFPAPSSNYGGPSEKAEGEAEDFSLKGKYVRFAKETEIKASAKKEKESIAEKEKKKPAIASFAKKGGKTSLAFILNPVDDFSTEEEGKKEEAKEEAKEEK